MTSIVFSKDRAMQLDAFLRSYRQHVSPPLVVVIFLATTERHRRAYDEVLASPYVDAFAQGDSFKATVLGVLPKSGLVSFFVDDQVFVRPWNEVEAEAGLSLRLGLHLTRCYPMNEVQVPPVLTSTGSGRLTWLWRDGQGDWGYPLSLDGHVFYATEMREMLERAAFSSPNTMEAALQQFSSYFFDRRGLCYPMSRVVNIPWNLVQTDYANRHAGAVGVDEMLTHWEAGGRIDLRQIYGVMNESCHQEFPFMLEAR